ncbi:MAG: TonB-dependent receptor [Flavobacterium sp.]|nr:TonB-dependent receptor [Flavobacterium sp.]
MLTNQKIKVAKWYLIGLFILAGTIANAQQRKITGKITSSTDSMGLPAANVLVKGTTSGSSSDIDGSYSILVSDNKTILVFNYVGYTTKEITVGDSNVINVVLSPGVGSLEEVVVVGYGTRKKSDMTGSVSRVKATELSAYPVLSSEQALQGRAAGVNVQSNNGGEPGAPVKIRIRGGNSINASGDALIVVDGFVGASMPAPEDVASMDILKDASATAIYGSRGSNGVILVTSKKGKSGKTTVEFSNSTSTQQVNNELNMLNSDQFYDYYKNILPTYKRGTANTDWQNEIYRPGFLSNTQLSFSGGTDAIKYYVSGNYFNQQGVVINSGLERYTILSNLDANITSKLKVGLNFFKSHIENNGIISQTNTGGSGAAGVVSSAYRFVPDLGIYNAQGVYTRNTVGDVIDNPYATAMENINDRINDANRINFYAAYEIVKGLEFKTTFGLSSEKNQFGKYQPSTVFAAEAQKGIASIFNSSETSIISENYLTYKTDLWIGKFTALGGYSYQKNEFESSTAAASGFVTDSFSYHNLGGGSLPIKPQSNATTSELASLFGRINYDIKDKYLFTFTGRRDGSSSFSKNYKYGFFPSGAIGWNVSKESFLENSETISNLKLRASYGLTGNPSISPYETLAKYSDIYASSGDVSVNAVVPTNFANDNLKWETTYQWNFGLDLGLFAERVNLSVDYYMSETKDLLFSKPLPSYIGIANPVQTQNIGELENKGLEFSLNTKNIITDSFSWTTDFNIAFNKNKILKLPDNNADVRYGTAPGSFNQPDSQVLRVGKPVGSFYGYIYDGVIQTTRTNLTSFTGFEIAPGGENFRDVNGDNILNSSDKTIIGDPNPDYILGFNNDFKYKNFDLNIFFQGSVGGEILNYTLLELGSGTANATTEALNAWTATNTDTDVPSAKVRTKFISSRFVYDASYIRLKNISIGYNVPKDFVSRLGLSRARFYVSAQNLWTLTEYPGADPEVNYLNNSNQNSNRNLGLDYGSYPNVESITLGFNLTF